MRYENELNPEIGLFERRLKETEIRTPLINHQEIMFCSWSESQLNSGIRFKTKSASQILIIRLGFINLHSLNTPRVSSSSPGSCKQFVWLWTVSARRQIAIFLPFGVLLCQLSLHDAGKGNKDGFMRILLCVKDKKKKIIKQWTMRKIRLVCRFPFDFPLRFFFPAWNKVMEMSALLLPMQNWHVTKCHTDTLPNVRMT